LREGFKEGVEQKIEFDCTTTTFDFVVQYLYTGTFNIPRFVTVFKEISALLDSCIFGEMVLLQLAPKAVKRIEELLVMSEMHLQKEHIRKAATELPPGHAARKLIADATVQGFLTAKQLLIGGSSFRFKEEVEDLDGYAADMARACMEIMSSQNSGCLSYKNPLTGAAFDMCDGPGHRFNPSGDEWGSIRCVDFGDEDL
jgi:hypothetical protein